MIYMIDELGGFMLFQLFEFSIPCKAKNLPFLSLVKHELSCFFLKKKTNFGQLFQLGAMSKMVNQQNMILLTEMGILNSYSSKFLIHVMCTHVKI